MPQIIAVAGTNLAGTLLPWIKRKASAQGVCAKAGGRLVSCIVQARQLAEWRSSSVPFGEKCKEPSGFRPGWFHMEYRGKSYTIVQGIEPNVWKWKVQLDEKTVICGDAHTRAAAVNSVVWRIDKALAKKAKPSAPPTSS
jgi:hypothetical protein